MAGLDALGVQQVLSTVQGQAMKIIGSSPILKNIGGSTLEKLKLPKHLDIGKIPDILAMVQSGGIGSFLQSPLTGALSGLTGAISSAQAAVSTVTGGAAIASALGGLSASAGSLSGLAANLVGATNVSGMPNNFDFLSHMSLAQSLDTSIPGSLSMDTAAGPVTASFAMGQIQTQVGAIAAAVVAGTMTPAAAAAAVAGLQASLDGTASASIYAITTLAASSLDIAAASSAVALMCSGPASVQAAMQGAIVPNQLAGVQAVVAAHIADVTALS